MSLSHRPIQERQGPLPSLHGGRLVIAFTFVAVEAMARRIKMDFNPGPPRTDGLDVGQGDALIILAEMKLSRNAWLLMGVACDLPAVEADGRRKPIEPRRG